MNKVLLVGLGVSNKSAYKALKKRGYIVECLVDEKYREDGYSYVNLEAIDINQYKYIIRSPGINYMHPFYKLIEYKDNVISEIELAYILSDKKGTYIGVTGSNGKTTSVTLLKKILDTTYPNVILAGNIGTPLCEYIDIINEDCIIVLELSSFQLEDFKCLHMHISSILSLCPNHLDSTPSLEYYYSSKFNITKNQDGDDYFIYPYQFSNYLGNKNVTTIDTNEIDYVFDTYLLGEFNHKNIAIIYHISMLMGVIEKDILNVISSFKGLDYRMQYIDTIENTIFINDSKSTTVDSTIACYNSFKGNKLLICGGKDKNIEFNRLEDIEDKCVFGEIRFILSGYKKEHLNELYTYIKNNYTKYDYVIFSPGTSSLDQYSSYKERGKEFNDIVMRLKNEKNRI